MREFFELVNEYPWTSFFLFLGCVILFSTIVSAIVEIIHGPDKRTIIIKDKDTDDDTET